jgi:hypothetical protein
LVVAVMVAATAVPAFALGQPVGYDLGLVGGAFAGLWLWMRDDPPEYVARWEWGAEAERRTARELRPLVAAGWFAVHDVPCRLGNMDHVVIGPGGVFVLETKCLGGDATIEGDEIRVQRRIDPDANYLTSGVGRRTRGRAVDLGAAFAAEAGSRPWVSAVVVIDDRFADGVIDGDRVTFVGRDRLRDWLLSRPDRLDQGQIEKHAATMRTLVARADAGDAKRRSQEGPLPAESSPFIIGVAPDA